MSRDPKTEPFNVKCPVCGVGVGQACRTRSTGRITEDHAARLHIAFGGTA